MALRLSEVEPVNYEYAITPTGNELPAMYDHWKKLECLLGKKLTVLGGGKSIQGEIRRQNCLPNHRMRWCTRILKIEPFQAFLLSASPAVSYVGIRGDEVADREGVDHSQIDGITNRYPLVEWGWGISEVLRYLDERGVEVPERTDCAMCFFQRLGEWWRLWKFHRQDYIEAEALEELVGHTLRSEARDSWPASLRKMRHEFEKGAVPKGANQADLWGTSKRTGMCGICAR